MQSVAGKIQNPVNDPWRKNLLLLQSYLLGLCGAVHAAGLAGMFGLVGIVAGLGTAAGIAGYFEKAGADTVGSAAESLRGC